MGEHDVRIRTVSDGEDPHALQVEALPEGRRCGNHRGLDGLLGARGERKKHHERGALTLTRAVVVQEYGHFC